MSEFSRFKKIDAHSHIGKFGSPFHIDFDGERLMEQMETYQIGKTILCAAGCHLNEETAEVYRRYPEQVIPVVWVNPLEGRAACDMLEHYIRDEGFQGAKLQPLFDAYTADVTCVDPVAEICRQ